jgi:sec-independent protein translocase protein TatC
VQFFVLGKMFAFIQHFTPERGGHARHRLVCGSDPVAVPGVRPGFQVPIVVMLLVRFGVVDIDKLKASAATSSCCPS